MSAVTCFSFADRIYLGPAPEVFLDGEEPETDVTACDACDSPAELVVDEVPLCRACLRKETP